jgi:hypothetical protein
VSRKYEFFLHAKQLEFFAVSALEKKLNEVYYIYLKILLATV